MESSSRWTGSPQSIPPTSKKLARQLLSYETNMSQNPEDLPSAVLRIYVQLQSRLAILIGEQGFDALWRRAVHLARQEFDTWDDTEETQSLPMLPPGLRGAVVDLNEADAHARLIAVFTCFISLLFTFIGEDLGVRLIRQAWPDLPSDTADAHTEGATL